MHRDPIGIEERRIQDIDSYNSPVSHTFTSSRQFLIVVGSAWHTIQA